MNEMVDMMHDMRNQIYDLMKEKKPKFQRDKVEKIRIENKTYFEIKPPKEEPIVEKKVEKKVEDIPPTKEESKPSVVAKPEPPAVKKVEEKPKKDEVAIQKKPEPPKP